MSGIELTPEQRGAVENRGGELLVSAAAGSGKTRVLVERVMGRIAQGADIDQFLMITYTNAAAAELRGKIMDAIFERIAEEPSNLRLRREAGLVGRAKIGTIHSFCASVIRENAHRLRLPPDFRIADEQEVDIMKRQALGELLDELYETGDPGFLELADTLGAGRDDRALEDVILDTHVKLLSHPDPAAWAQKQSRALALEGVTDVGQTVWGRVIMDRARRAARFWRERMDYLVDEASADPVLDKGYGRSFRATVDSLDRFILALNGTWDEARAASKIDFPNGRVSGYEEVKAQRKCCREAMEKISTLFWDSSSRALEDMRAVAPAMWALMSTVLEFDRRWSELKRRRGVLDFSDQEHMALELLTDPATGAPSDIAREISSRFLEITVDEYQDVNEIQERIVAAVSRGGTNVFTVGDVKQSIYRFRLADPGIFLRKYGSFKDACDAAPGEARRIVLSRNFRSRAGVLEAANFVFKNIMSTELGDLDYTEREYLYPGAKFCPSDEPETELDVIDLSSESEEDEDDRERAEAVFAARRIREIVEHSQVSDGPDKLRPATYGDVCVLMRSPRSAMPVWQEVFGLEGVPLASDQSADFFSEFEVSLTLSILTVIDNPRQDIPLIAVLRSPVYGFTGEELGEIRLYDRGGDFYSALAASAGEMEKSARFLEKLSALRRAAPDMTADELIWHVYGETELFAVVSAMPEGKLRRENLMLLLELAKECEGAGWRGLYGFITYVRRLRERGAGPQRVLRAPENAVTVMSIHKSKGLEFPIVVLAGLTHRFNTEDTRARLLIHPELGVGPKRTDLERKIEYHTVARRAASLKLRQEMLSEEERVLYVAMTRAKDKLVMLMSFADAEQHIGKLLNCELPVPPELLDGCQSMADWILLPALRRPESGAIRFGAPNVPCDTAGDVWDVRLIQGVPQARRGRIGEIPEERPVSASVPPELIERLEYVYPHAAAVNMPSKLTATELKGTFSTQEANEEAGALDPAASRQPDMTNDSTAPSPAPSDVEKLEKPPRRPDFMVGRRGLTPAQRGTAVHTVMQYADHRRCTTVRGAASEVQRLKELGTVTPEQAAAVDPGIIARFFASDPGRLILGAERVWRELKFSILVDSGDIPGCPAGEKLLLQGVVDCCVDGPEGLTVIDFKTDYVTDSTVDERATFYRGQLAAYALAMERILGRPVKSRLVCFLTAGMWREV